MDLEAQQERAVGIRTNSTQLSDFNKKTKQAQESACFVIKKPFRQIEGCGSHFYVSHLAAVIRRVKTITGLNNLSSHTSSLRLMPYFSNNSQLILSTSSSGLY